MPDVAIGTEQVRKFVMVVNADNVATPKYVTLGQLVDGLRVVKTGLDAGRHASSSTASCASVPAPRSTPQQAGRRRRRRAAQPIQRTN